MLFLRSIFFAILQPGTVTILIPYWLISSRSVGASSRYQTLRYLGLPLIIIGATTLLWCIWDFFASGRGTISPIDPPKHLVVRGLYRYVRNPMYVSVVTILLGESIFFRSLPVLIEAGVFFVLANLFILLYEEPTLRRQFGESYEQYKQSVGRWTPRLRAKPSIT
jgi:protein-S-isoprenylcysteine O-methyltransferase Ste14